MGPACAPHGGLFAATPNDNLAGLRQHLPAITSRYPVGRSPLGMRFLGPVVDEHDAETL